MRSRNVRWVLRGGRGGGVRLLLLGRRSILDWFPILGRSFYDMSDEVWESRRMELLKMNGQDEFEGEVEENSVNS